MKQIDTLTNLDPENFLVVVEKKFADLNIGDIFRAPNRCPAQRADAAHRVEQAALLVARREISVAGRLDALGNLIQRPVQRPRLPVIGVGSAV